MSDWNYAISVVLAHEGGWVSNPADPGGETNWGISTLMIKRENITAEELGVDPATMFQSGYLKPMPRDAAVAIYKKYFWDKYSYGLLVDSVAATKVFDCSVNCGPGRAGMMAQKAANQAGKSLQVDGILGGHSYNAINDIAPHTFVLAMADQMRFYYNDIVNKNPTLHVFLSNWLHRASWGT